MKIASAALLLAGCSAPTSATLGNVTVRIGSQPAIERECLRELGPGGARSVLAGRVLGCTEGDERHWTIRLVEGFGSEMAVRIAHEMDCHVLRNPRCVDHSPGASIDTK